MRRVIWVIVPLLLLGLLAVAMFATREPSPTTAFTLRPGDCFDLPTDAQVGDIATLDCTAPHDAEAFVAGAIGGSATASGPPSASGSASSSDPASVLATASTTPSGTASDSASASIGVPGYPGDAAIASWVSASCGIAAQQAYLGADVTTRPELVVGYFFPTPDAWLHGERQVTCYLHSVGSKLSAPLRGAGSSASPS
ncbi:MAG TPA: septum formation family protein [Candidatus Limnocylindrales bacterium]